MNVGVCKVTLRLPENQSLKGKRRVIRSLCSRVKAKFNVSIAEVDDNDLWQLATLGIVCTGNEAVHVTRVLDSVMEFIERSGEDFEIVGQEQETLPGF